MSRIAQWHGLVLFPKLPAAIAEQRVNVSGVRASAAARRALEVALGRVKKRHIQEVRISLVRIHKNGKGTQLPLHI